MSRLNQVNPDQAEGKAKDLLDIVKSKLGAAINLTQVMANRPAALEGYLQFSGALAGGAFSPKEREAVALAVAGVNGCEYCASAHTFISKNLKVDAAESVRNLRGQSDDARTQAILSLVRRIADTRGQVSDADIAAARASGLDDGDITEAVAQVALNTFTNYLNNVAKTDVDFPVVQLTGREAA